MLSKTLPRASEPFRVIPNLPWSNKHMSSELIYFLKTHPRASEPFRVIPNLPWSNKIIYWVNLFPIYFLKTHPRASEPFRVFPSFPWSNKIIYWVNLFPICFLKLTLAQASISVSPILSVFKEKTQKNYEISAIL